MKLLAFSLIAGGFLYLAFTLIMGLWLVAVAMRGAVNLIGGLFK